MSYPWYIDHNTVIGQDSKNRRFGIDKSTGVLGGMKMKAFIRGVALATIMIVLLAASIDRAEAAEVTVGRFIQELALAKELDARSTATARASLAAAGLRLPTDLEDARVLTEVDVTRIARAIGLNVTTSTPGAVFDDASVDRFFAAFGGEISGGSGSGGSTAECSHPSGDCSNPGQGSGPGNGNGGPPFDPFSKGKGRGGTKGKGKVSPSQPY